jgi:hypothetical protein
VKNIYHVEISVIGGGRLPDRLRVPMPKIDAPDELTRYILVFIALNPEFSPGVRSEDIPKLDEEHKKQIVEKVQQWLKMGIQRKSKRKKSAAPAPAPQRSKSARRH